MKPLKNVLLINAVSSGATGLLLVILPGFFSSLFEVNVKIPFVAVGLFLIAFALFVMITWKAEPVNEKMVGLVTLLDTSWVLASLAIIVIQPFHASLLGYAMIAAVALWVSLMAILQYRGMKRLVA